MTNKVIYSVGTKLAGGGIGDISYYAAKGLSEAGLLKKVICFGYDKAKCQLSQEQIVVLPPPLPHPPLLPMRHYYFLTNNYFDLLARHFIKKTGIFFGWSGMQLMQQKKAKKFGALLVTNGASTHINHQTEILATEFQKFGLKANVQNRFLLKKIITEFSIVDFVIAASPVVKESFVNNNVPEEKIVIIPFGVDSQKFKLNVRKFDKFTFVFAGTVSLRKGVHYLLQAWQELKLKDAQLLLLGEVSYELKRFIKNYYADETIKFMGFSRKPEEVLAKAHVFVFPSLEEGSALVTYEAMAAGLPVITTYNAGSLVRDGLDGFIIPVCSVDEIKQKMLYFYKNPEQAAKFGLSGREFIKNYTWQRYGKEIAKFIQKL